MYAQSSGKKLNLDYHKQRVEVADTLCRIETTVIPNKPVKNGKVTDVRFYTLEEYERIFGVSNPSDEYFDTIYYLYRVPTAVPPPADYGATPRQPLPVARRELLSVKTNVLFDFAYIPAGYNRFCPIPNIAVEYYPLHGHFTFGASLDFPWWKDYDAHKYMEVRNYQVEGRYYFESGDISRRPVGEGPAFRHWYLSAYVHTFIYSVCINASHGMGDFCHWFQSEYCGFCPSPVGSWHSAYFQRQQQAQEYRRIRVRLLFPVHGAFFPAEVGREP